MVMVAVVAGSQTTMHRVLVRVRNVGIMLHGLPGERRKRRVGGQASNTADSQTPDFADMILALWMHNARKGQRQARAMKAEKTREKVRTWLDSTKD